MTTASRRGSSPLADDFSDRVRANQELLTAALKPRYDFIVCGAGSSGSVVARRLAENPDTSVLLLEAGGDDDHPPAGGMTRSWTSIVVSKIGTVLPTRPIAVSVVRFSSSRLRTRARWCRLPCRLRVLSAFLLSRIRTGA